MFRKLTFLTLLAISPILLGETIFSQATDQQRQERQERRERREREAMQRGNMMFQGKTPPGTVTVLGRSVIGSVNEGFGNSLVIMGGVGNPELRSQLGLTDEQVAALRNAGNEIRTETLMRVPKYLERFKNMGPQDHDAIQKELQSDFQALRDHVEKNVTPEQMQKSRTVVFQSLGGLDSPLMNLDAMSALDLSDEQRQKAEATFKALEQERVAQLEDSLKLAEKFVEYGPDMTPEQRAELDEMRQSLEVRIYATGKKLGEQLRGHLTAEQRDREKYLIANRPGFLPPLPRQMRGEDGEGSSGFGSWRPGQGSMRDNSDEKQRRRAFPKQEAVEE